VRNLDTYHPFRRRRITADNLPEDEKRARMMRGIPFPEPGSEFANESFHTCDACGGSRFAPVHFSRRAWGTIGDFLHI
jgi:hypothetical protein